MMHYANFQDVLKRVAETAEFSGVNLKGVNQSNAVGNTPLSVVIVWGDIEAAKVLINAGANVNAELEYGDTPLHEAARFDRVEIAQLLLENGANKLVNNDDGMSPHSLAKLYRYDALADLLMP